LEKENLSFSLKDLAVNGKDMMDMGLIGKDIGDGLKYLLEAVLNDNVENDKMALLNYLNNKGI
jgi:tRNA nucleotidyltransferase (CCA-adding enzyme)